MYGWRGRIGHICPSIPIDMIMNEFQLMLPDGVQMVYSSLHVQNIQNSDFDRALERLTEATEQIADGEVDCIIAGGGPLVAMRGTDADIVERCQSAIVNNDRGDDLSAASPGSQTGRHSVTLSG